MENLQSRVYEVYQDEAFFKNYSDIVKTFNRLNNKESYTASAKSKMREKAREKINDLKANLKDRASEMITKADEKSNFKLPEQQFSPSDNKKLSQQLEVSNELNLIQAEIQSATGDELVEIARSYEDKQLLARPVDRLVKARLKFLEDETSLRKLETLRQPDKSNIKKATSTNQLLGAADRIAVISKNDEGEYDFKFRQVTNDLMKGSTPDNQGRYIQHIGNELKEEVV